MAGILQHLRSSTLDKRPNPASMVDGQVAINYASGAPGMFFKNSNGDLVKVGPVHVGSTAPNASPASGGTAGNSVGEQWLDNSGGTYVFKIWDGSAWRSEAGEFVNATGDTMTGDLVMNNANIVFEGSTDDGYETTLTVVDPTADRTITLPNVTGTVVTTGDTGTVTSTMIADGTIVNADINASAAIAGTKIDPDFGSQTIETTGVFSAAGGSDAAPSITFTGDTNTGIYSPGADQVALSTNGTQRINIEADGDINIDSGGVFYDATNNRLAIGTTSPRQALTFGGLTSSSTSTPDCIDLGATYTSTSASTNLKFKLYVDSSGNTYGFTVNESSHLEYYAGTVSSPGNHVFLTGGSERARIDSSGRLLVGTSSARSNFFNTVVSPQFQIEGAGDNDRQACIISSSSTAAFGAVQILAHQKSGTIGGNTILASGDLLGLTSFQGSDGTQFVEGARIEAFVDGTPGADDMPGRLVFSVTADGGSSPTTSPSAMTINSGQEVLIGYSTDNGAYKLQVNSQIFATSATIATSDGRYKENVATLDGCVDLVKALRPVSFDWKAQQPITRVDEDGETVVVREAHNFPDGKQVGFIAQEVEEVLADKPWLGSVIKQNVRPAVTDADGNELAPEEEFLGIAEGNLVAVLTSALKDAIGRIESLEAEVAALKA